MSQETIAALQNSVAELTQGFASLTPILLKEREIIKKRRVDDIDAINGEIETQLAALQRLDQFRQLHTKELAKSLGLAGTKVTLSSLDEALDGKAGLKALREELVAAIEKADKVNQENQAIFKGVQVATETLLRAVTGESSTGAGYNRQGKRQSSGSFHRFSKHL
ncbi:MAG: flagellar protein FlgN [Magnetococcales bacterium]|nr:flagellar protein FlgN [Magnetococcales bacterium]